MELSSTRCTLTDEGGRLLEELHLQPSQCAELVAAPEGEEFEFFDMHVVELTEEGAKLSGGGANLQPEPARAVQISAARASSGLSQGQG